MRAIGRRFVDVLIQLFDHLTSPPYNRDSYANVAQYHLCQLVRTPVFNIRKKKKKSRRKLSLYMDVKGWRLQGMRSVGCMRRGVEV